MKRMGIRELKTHMSEAIRDVQEGATIEVTLHGKVVATLVPAGRPSSPGEVHTALASLDSLAADIGRHVAAPTDVAAAIGEMRR
jgi:antitoxin (DNA-binding transcriptional repressor) of toxin-antitoxin stability system